MANRPRRFDDFRYAGFNRYFLTICTKDRTPVYLDIEFGEWVAAQFLRLAILFKFEIIVYCVMPDHAHLLVHGNGEDALLKPYIDQCKQVTGYEWKHNRGQPRRLWQEGYFDRILRDHDRDEGVIRYILQNPVRAGLVDDPRDYPLIGSSKYDINELLECTAVWSPPWK
jgi:putative transposase